MINHDKEKLCNTIIYFVNHTKKCTKTKLMKLLYELDFMHFSQTGKSVTGLEYYAWQHGPYPKTLGDEINCQDAELTSFVAVLKQQSTSGKEFITFKSKKQFDPKYFTKRELRLLQETSEIFQEASADDMVTISHLPNRPWEKTLKEKGEKKHIDYFLAIDDPELKNEYLENAEDRKHIESIMG